MARNYVETEYRYKDVAEYTESEIEALCCELVEVPPCAKVGKKVSTWEGGEDQGNWPESTKALIEAASDPTNLIEIRYKTRENPCGTKEINYPKTGLNCCDEILPLEIDVNKSVSVMGDDSFGIIYITIPAYKAVTVTVRGSGFYAIDDGRSKSAVYTGGDMFFVFTKGACGSCNVIIDDGCSTATHTVLSVNGEWKLVESNDFQQFQPPGPYLSALSVISNVTEYFRETTYGWIIGESDGVRIRQDFNPGYSNFDAVCACKEIPDNWTGTGGCETVQYCRKVLSAAITDYPLYSGNSGYDGTLCESRCGGDRLYYRTCRITGYKIWEWVC